MKSFGKIFSLFYLVDFVALAAFLSVAFCCFQQKHSALEAYFRQSVFAARCLANQRWLPLLLVCATTSATTSATDKVKNLDFCITFWQKSTRITWFPRTPYQMSHFTMKN